MTTDWQRSIVPTKTAPMPAMVLLADYQKLQKEFARNLEAFERVSAEVDGFAAKILEIQRAAALAAPIVDAMCTMFKPDVPLDDDDTVGPKLSSMPIKNLEVLDTLTYGQLEVAAGALGFVTSK